MTKQEFDAIVNDAVKSGAKREDAENYVIAGYGLDPKIKDQSSKVQDQKSKAKK